MSTRSSGRDIVILSLYYDRLANQKAASYVSGAR